MKGWPTPERKQTLDFLRAASADAWSANVPARPCDRQRVHPRAVLRTDRSRLSRRAEPGPVLDRQCRQMCVRGQIPGGPEGFEQLLHERPVSNGGFDQSGRRAGANQLSMISIALDGWQRLSEDRAECVVMRRKPRTTDQGSPMVSVAGHRSFPPRTGAFVMRRLHVVCVDQQVDVDDDHFARPLPDDLLILERRRPAPAPCPGSPREAADPFCTS